MPAWGCAFHFDATWPGRAHQPGASGCRIVTTDVPRKTSRNKMLRETLRLLHLPKDL